MPGFSPEQYLLPSETTIVDVRRHWAVLAKPVGIAILVALLVFAVSYVLPSDSYAQTACWLVLIGDFLRLSWVIFDHHVERFVITNRRVILTTGILTRKVAIMPLTKVTDMTYQRSVPGQILGYGSFIVESAGQVQALNRIDYLPRPDDTYQKVSRVLFGEGAAADGGD